MPAKFRLLGYDSHVALKRVLTSQTHSESLFSYRHRHHHRDFLATCFQNKQCILVQQAAGQQGRKRYHGRTHKMI